MLECPKCKSGDTHRSRARSTWEQWRKQFTSKRAYRCGACGWRGWGPDTGTRFDDEERETAARAIAPDPPDLNGHLVPASEAPPQNPLNLDEIDLSLKPRASRPLSDPADIA